MKIANFNDDLHRSSVGILLNYFSRCRMIASMLLSVLILTSCSFGPSRPAPDAPGLYGSVDHWNGGTDDVNGEVGHRLEVAGPKAKCVNVTGGDGGAWSGNARIVSGRLPDGLSFDDHYHVAGIPTARGNWIVELQFYNLTCNGEPYTDYDFTQELRFHITGSGKVIE